MYQQTISTPSGSVSVVSQSKKILHPSDIVKVWKKWRDVTKRMRILVYKCLTNDIMRF